MWTCFRHKCDDQSLQKMFKLSNPTKSWKIQKKVWNPLWNPESCIFFMFLRKGRFQPSGWESPMEEHGQWAHLAVRAKVLDTTFEDHRRPADFWLQLNTVGQVVPYRPVLGQFNYHKSPKPRLRIAAACSCHLEIELHGSFSLFASYHSVASEDADASDGQQTDLMAVLSTAFSFRQTKAPEPNATDG